MTITLSPNYLSIFDSRMCIITGVGRSGTTILGKLVGSMSPAIYLFEPVLVRLMPLLVDKTDSHSRSTISQLLLSILFADYIATTINGRALNFNKTDDSFYGHYWTHEELESRWKAPLRRQHLDQYLVDNRINFVVKIPEFQPLLDSATSIFPNPKFIHITRNGFDVVASALKRSWYSDAFLNAAFLDWMEKDSSGLMIPWFVERKARADFARWTPTTRAAYVWRRLTEIGLSYAQAHEDQCRQFKYEQLARTPEAISRDLADWLGLTVTDLTKNHIASVEGFSRGPSQIALTDIEEPERAAFANLMERLEYH